MREREQSREILPFRQLRREKHTESFLSPQKTAFTCGLCTGEKEKTKKTDRKKESRTPGSRSRRRYKSLTEAKKSTLETRDFEEQEQQQLSQMRPAAASTAAAASCTTTLFS